MKDGRETNRALISLTGLHRSRVNRWNARTGRSAPSWELRLGLPAHLVSPESSGIFVQMGLSGERRLTTAELRSPPDRGSRCSLRPVTASVMPL
jgi:hypothetical protein